MLRSPLVRVLDLNRPSNRVALAGFVGSAALARALGRSWAQAGAAGLTAFLAWSTARELDPDEEGSANVALALAALGAPLTPGALSGALAFNEGLRALAGTTGLPLRESDAVSLAGLALACAQRGGGLLAFTPGVALALSRRLNDALSPNERGVVLACLGALPALLPRASLPDVHPAVRLAAALALLVSANAHEVGSVVSVTDHGQRPVSAERLRLTRKVALGALGASVALSGGAGMRFTVSLWAAWLGTWWVRRKTRAI